MELAFEAQDLRSICESESRATDVLGLAVAAALRARLADLTAADTLAELPVGSPRIETRPGGGTVVVITLTDEVRLLLAANHRKNPLRPDGAVDWYRVSRLRVLAIEGTDDHI